MVRQPSYIADASHFWEETWLQDRRKKPGSNRTFTHIGQQNGVIQIRKENKILRQKKGKYDLGI